MPDPRPKQSDSRQQPRLKVPAMYTVLKARVAGAQRYRWSGYIYDISSSGMRFELDERLDPGSEIEVRGTLPGQGHTSFRAVGRVVRLHDDEQDFGPYRMGMTFDSFAQALDRRRLDTYLNRYGLRTAA